MDLAEIIGNTAAIIGTITFLPQVIKVFKTKQTKDLALVMLLLLNLTALLWLVYGLCIVKTPMIWSNLVILFLSGYLTIMKLKYG